MSRLGSLAKRIIPTLVLLLAVFALLVLGVGSAQAQCNTTSTTTTSTSTTTTSTTTTSTTTTTLACQAFPATGQTTCWDSSGTVPCAGTGQDGDIKAGAPLSYTDNGDGTITDNNTGLVWEKQSYDGSIHDVVTAVYTWDDAFAVHVATLNGTSFAGHSDWRLPNVKELESIVNYENGNPAVSAAFNTGCAPGCTVLTCSCTRVSNYYWSSTTYANDPNYAWIVYFFGGFPGTEDKGFSNNVRAVRGGSCS